MVPFWVFSFFFPHTENILSTRTHSFYRRGISYLDIFCSSFWSASAILFPSVHLTCKLWLCSWLWILPEGTCWWWARGVSKVCRSSARISTMQRTQQGPSSHWGGGCQLSLTGLHCCQSHSWWATGLVSVLCLEVIQSKDSHELRSPNWGSPWFSPSPLWVLGSQSAVS